MAVPCSMRLIARAKAIDDNREVVGYVRVPEFAPREEITRILEIKTGESIPVDPLTVEMFTGLRDALSGKRIFEGDVIQYYHEFDCEFDGYDEPEGEEPLCEVCLPLVLPKAGVRKQLYEHTPALADGTYYSDPSGWGDVSHLWDAMEWVLVGRVDDETFETRYENTVSVMRGELEDGEGEDKFVPDDFMATFAVDKNGSTSVYHVACGDGERCRAVVPFFGTQKRRRHLLKHIFDSPNYFRRHPELACKREEWQKLYEAYVAAWEAK